jgi:hypothetical protein
MGNIIGLPAAVPSYGQRVAQTSMNIPPDTQRLNDPNNPYSRQMIGVVLNGLIPMAGVCLFGNYYYLFFHQKYHMKILGVTPHDMCRGCLYQKVLGKGRYFASQFGSCMGP